jgi:hypothetical protein
MPGGVVDWEARPVPWNNKKIPRDNSIAGSTGRETSERATPLPKKDFRILSFWTGC